MIALVFIAAERAGKNEHEVLIILRFVRVMAITGRDFD